ncbi:LysM peptidoglycan-binding domain-containing protein [Billgrantia kenyensis]|uniref:LysM peptidoglycan-binding domain-containing protein n=1 Tax=Billgrantia kenyensis TaxID=321266 RepID=A0A7V9W058_9GAMM|nr:LysM peptidoglycan-binding domain-containing protein [Halomonas kenyensis]MBA2778497.1 LysM peptidoglycan-binding domain-containing protein [Halomonas kenyensis]MCG6661698.1 LysM peptidoglycan-binding domain-containing protein [Halomonas kenyensis]
MNETVTGLRNRSAQGVLVGWLGAGLLAVLLSQAAHAQQGGENDAEAVEQEAAEQVDLPEEANDTEEADAQARQERDDLDQRLQERERQLRDAQRELAALRARLPAAEGGDLDLDGALRSASVTAGAIRATRTELMRAGGRDAALEESIDELIDELENDQRLVARGLDANLYRVQRGDTLAGIAGRFYGSSQRWQELHEANRHVLENPDLVWPGLTLVVPR